MQVHLASLGLDFEALGISQAGNDSGDGSRSPDMRAASENGVLICSIGRKIGQHTWRDGGAVLQLCINTQRQIDHTFILEVPANLRQKSEDEVEILVLKISSSFVPAIVAQEQCIQHGLFTISQSSCSLFWLLGQIDFHATV